MPALTHLAARLALAFTVLAAAPSIALAAEPAPGAEDADAARALDTADDAGVDAASDAELDALLDVGAREGAAGSGIKWGGYAEFGAAYTLPEPDRWSHLRARAELSGSGEMASRVGWKLTARAEADGAFDLEDDHYPAAVRRDQRRDFMLREAYVDIGHGDWEFRLGRQHVIWGEMVGFFFADVVSARDLRDFLLPEFESMRIGQWAARAEYFGADTHFELLWIPKPSFDEIGVPGSDFYALPWLPAGTAVREDEPGDNDLENGNWGARVSHLVGGWDLSAFYYRSYDISPTVYAYEPGAASLRHDRLHQVGGTFSKDLGSFVLKGEAVHTRGRSLNTFTPRAALGHFALGLEPTDMVDYALGADIPAGDWRFNVQYYGRWLDDHHPLMVSERSEGGVTFQVMHGVGSAIETEFLAVSSLNRSDYMLRPKLTWKFAPAWRVVTGLDIFGGSDEGLFSAYDRKDRAYVEVRHWF